MRLVENKDKDNNQLLFGCDGGGVASDQLNLDSLSSEDGGWLLDEYLSEFDSRVFDFDDLLRVPRAEYHLVSSGSYSELSDSSKDTLNKMLSGIAPVQFSSCDSDVVIDDFILQSFF